jgi:hypothetical protein
VALTRTPLDPRAVAGGALIVLAIGLPPVLLARAVKGTTIRGESHAWIPAAILAVVVAPLVGGAYAASRRPRAALAHGAAAAGAGCVVEVALAVARRLLIPHHRETVSLLGLVPTFVLFIVLFTSLGMAGGYFAFRRSTGRRQ